MTELYCIVTHLQRLLAIKNSMYVDFVVDVSRDLQSQPSPLTQAANAIVSSNT